MFDVVVIGGANTDYLVRGTRLPEAGETVQGDTFEAAEAGGKGVNQAVATARLGMRVAFIGRVGADARGEALRRRLMDEGVDVRHVAIDPRAATGVALINVDERGEKQILVAPGANLHLSPSDVKKAAKVIREARVLVLQFEVPMKANLAAARIAHGAGVPIVLDPAPAVRAPKELLRLVSVIRPNEHEAEALTGVKVHDRKSARKSAERLLAHGIRAAIIAAGADGNLVVWRKGDQRGEELWLPKMPVKTIDATGAGDAFAAGLAVALAEGHSVMEAALFANAAAALATTRLGAQPALPKRGAVLSLLRRSGSKAEAKSFARIESR
ncbi:MAG: ribokinase [Chthoniobacter sp.]|jgi:ribokinase|nr:ribokinase [Chthoniobacter sp.]